MPGGSVNAAYHLINFIEGAPVKFFGVVSEICASTGSLVFASLPEGHRFIMPHGKVMIHQPAITPYSMINSTSIKSLSEMIGDSERMIYQYQIFLNHHLYSLSGKRNTYLFVS